MTVEILAAIPYPAFGELLRLSLEEGGGYHVNLVQTAREALAVLDRTPCALAILDSELSDQAFVPFIQRLQLNYPNLKIALIPPGNDAHHPLLTGLKVDGYIKKPFYLPDLQALLDQIAPQTKPGYKDVENGSPSQVLSSILNDRPASARKLAELIKDTQVESAIILQNLEPWAAAGILNQNAVNELTEIVARYWSNQPGTSMVRFSNLVSIGKEYLIYASSLATDKVLVLLFDVNLPLTRVRYWNSKISQNFLLTEMQNQEQESEQSTLRDVNEEIEEMDLSEEEEFFQSEQFDISAILAEAPPPDPEVIDWSTASTELTEILSQTPQLDETEPLLLPWEQDIDNIKESTLPPPTNDVLEETHPTDVPHSMETPKNQLADEPSPAAHADGGYSLPGQYQPLTSFGQLEPVSPAMSHISYTCVLIPRLATHLLAGELAEKLSLWVPQLCLAFSWRMAGIAIRPEYLQWSVYVNPAIPPGNIIRTMRDRTSERIFSHFPAFRIHNPSGEFWAQAYLVVNGCQPPSPDLLSDFIFRSRQRQGS